jgi:Na+/H+-dicarboxylate symporter
MKKPGLYVQVLLAIVIGIVLVSVLPLAWEWWAARQRSHTR